MDIHISLYVYDNKPGKKVSQQPGVKFRNANFGYMEKWKEYGFYRNLFSILYFVWSIY